MRMFKTVFDREMLVNFFDLKKLIVLLSVFTSAAVLAIAIFSSYKVQKDLLIKNTLESNRVYAEKLAENIEVFFESMRKKLEYSSKMLSINFNNKKYLAEEVKRLRGQSIYFNSAHIINSEGVLLAVDSEMNLDKLVGEKLVSIGVKEAIETRKPLITSPYISAGKRMIIVVSQPVFDVEGSYLGYVGGGIYLDGYNYFDRMLGRHFYENGSYIYIIDSKGSMIQHADKSRLGENVTQLNNPVVNELMQGNSGSMALINSRGVHMLASYIYIAPLGWGVVVQTPTAAALAGLNEIILSELRNTLPFLCILIFLFYLLARYIATPLQKLAGSILVIEHIDKAAKVINKVHPWYFEAVQLKKALLASLEVLHEQFALLSQEALSDPLTKLYNKRALGNLLAGFRRSRKGFSVIAIDIDYFKSVNDQYGHAVGDGLIKYLADAMRKCSRSSDLLFRNGGEEFLILLPDTNIEHAFQIAERLRKLMMSSEVVGLDRKITVSAGISQWFPGEEDSFIESSLEEADKALYMAKQFGRNRVVIYPTRDIDL